MPVSARASVSFRPWIAAAIALALMLSLATVVAPAVATGEPDGTVAFVDPPAFLVGDAHENATFVVAVTGDFSIDAAVLSDGVDGIDVTVELLSGDPETTVASGTRSSVIVMVDGISVPTATVTVPLGHLEDGQYTVRATATTDSDPIAPLGFAELGPLPYYPNGTVCVGDCNVEVTNDDGFTATVALLGGGFVNLELPDTSPYVLDQDACPGDHTRLPETVLFDILVGDGGAETAEITVDLTRRARQLETNNGISQYQFCYIGGGEFIDRAGQRAEVFEDEVYEKLTHGPALLPDCDASDPQAPCVLDRRSRGGGAQFTFLVPTGDPMFR